MDSPLRSKVDESEDSSFEKGDMKSPGPPMARQRGVQIPVFQRFSKCGRPCGKLTVRHWKNFGMDRPLRGGVDESEDSPFEKGDMKSPGPPMARQRGV